MEPKLQEKLQIALQEKKLNQTAYDEIIKWLTQEEFVEFVPQLLKKLTEMNGKF